MNAKEEAFAIKMEEMMKEMLSTEAFEQLATAPGPEFVVDDNTTTSPITEEDMIRIIKKEPNEKPLLVEDCTPSNSEKLNKVFDHRNNIRRYSQTSMGGNERPDEFFLTEQQISAEQNSTEVSPPEPIIPDSILSEQALPELTIPVRTLRSNPTTIPELTIPEPNIPEPTIPEPTIPIRTLRRSKPTTITEQSSSENSDLDSESFQNDKDSVVDVKPIIKKPTIDYVSIHCDICGISFNDNFGFRRHLNHMHQTNNLAAGPEKSNSSSEPVDPEISSSSSPSPPPLTPPLKRQTCNLKFKRQYRANLKVKHIKSTLSIPESHSKSSIQCRFCKKEGWTESEYRRHLIQKHSTELNPLTKQITDSNIERIKDAAAAAATNLLNTTNAFTSGLIPNSTITNADTLALPSENDSLMTDSDISILDIPYDPITDISENQRRTYNFFQAYMLDIS